MYDISFRRMKSLSILSFLLLLATVSFSQNRDIEVYEKKDGDKILVMARNTGKVAYSVKVKITSTGMDVKPSDIVEAVIPAGYMKEMATITPRPGESWSYGFEVSFTESAGTSAPPKTTTTSSKSSGQLSSNTASQNTASLTDARIVLYNKPGCSRCAYAKKQMTSLGITYEEVNTQVQSPEVTNMWSELSKSGFAGGSVTMPVIRVDGKYHYDIKDLNDFVGKLKT